MAKLLTLLSLISITFFSKARASEDMDGPVRYTLDLSQKYETYKLTEKDKEWAQKLVIKFKYKGDVIYFVRTSIPVTKDSKIIHDSVYKSIGEMNISMSLIVMHFLI